MRILTALASVTLLASTASAQTFGGYQMQLNGSGGNSSPQVVSGKLQLINDLYGAASSAFTTTTFNFTPATAFSTSFTLHYAYTSDVFGFGGGGDGIAFVMQGGAATALGSGGYGVGYDGIANSLGVSFRSFWNDAWIGWDNSAFQQAVAGAPAGLLIGPGDDFTVAVNLAYDGANNMSVGYATSRGTTFAPQSFVVDPTFLGNTVRLGFTGGSGAATQFGEVDNWSVSGLTQTTTTPEPATFGLFAFGASGIAALARRRRSGQDA
ncbi:MAG: PEP-CTERM sorting domain-containing protein [bacterium]